MISVATEDCAVQSGVCSHNGECQKDHGFVMAPPQKPTKPATSRSNCRSSAHAHRNAKSTLPEDVQIRNRNFLQKITTNAVDTSSSSKLGGIFEVIDALNDKELVAAIKKQARQVHQVKLPATTEVKGLRPGLLSL